VAIFCSVSFAVSSPLTKTNLDILFDFLKKRNLLSSYLYTTTHSANFDGYLLQYQDLYSSLFCVRGRMD
jgi:hypothetical protein